MERQRRVHSRLKPRPFAREVPPSAIGVLRAAQRLQSNAQMRLSHNTLSAYAQAVIRYQGRILEP